MARRFPIHPAHPERLCWGCDRYCASDAMICGNGSVRTPHPAELFGDDWGEWGLDAAGSPPDADPPAEEPPCPSPTTARPNCTTT